MKKKIPYFQLKQTIQNQYYISARIVLQLAARTSMLAEYANSTGQRHNSTFINCYLA